jgi:hypothetical protein
MCSNSSDQSMVSVFTTRLNCFPICADWLGDAALTLPISPPELKSYAPWVPQLIRFTLEWFRGAINL